MAERLQGQPRRVVAAAALVLLMLGGLTAPAAAASTVEVAGAQTGVTPVAETGAEATADGPTIRETQTVALTPATPGSLQVTFQYEIPESVSQLRVQELTAPAVTVTGTDGFSRDGDEYVWDVDFLPRLKPWDSSAWVIQAVPEIAPEANFPPLPVVLRFAESSLVW
ncbi:hypothetical protein [Halosegnis sp.]|uniref:hypothetical protein n=1 Tax=Halosegnis sp. TaxID=2864959 RepID=UPI0035D4EC2D